MKYLFLISAFLFLTTCSGNASRAEKLDKEVELPQQELVHKDSMVVVDSTSNEIPPNGRYRYDMAFAEWGGKSMGEKVTVEINDQSIKVIYEGDGQLTQSKQGSILEEGIIMKHKSGVWIIAKKPTDIELDEIGGCTGGPTIIDFENKKYWTC